jgi:GNAT superfamily N-acetyltransferase
VVVGFVNIVTDGGDHAFLIDTKTRGTHQRRGIATHVVAFAAEHARAAGCEGCTSTSTTTCEPSTSKPASSNPPLRG